MQLLSQAGTDPAVGLERLKPLLPLEIPWSPHTPQVPPTNLRKKNEARRGWRRKKSRRAPPGPNPASAS